MSVIVDSIVTDLVQLDISPADVINARIDVVFACKGIVGIINGTPSTAPAPPTLKVEYRKLATIYINPFIDKVLDEYIKEA